MSEGLPLLAVGDVHGDLERLFEGLAPYPADKFHTVFLGDLVNGGPFGVGALRFARDRPNSTVLLGNHEVMMLWALRDSSRLAFFQGLGGEMHDLAELRRDKPLQAWLAERPLLWKGRDILFQHADSDLYARLLEPDDLDPIGAINLRAHELLRSGGEADLWEILSPGKVFEVQRLRLEAWLEVTNARHLVHGHKPHGRTRPYVYHDGLAANFDGGLSRFRSGARYRRKAPVGASVGPVDFLPQWRS